MLCIINYGSGNIAALANICRREKIEHCIVDDPREISQGTHFLLPGVGAFDPTMETLETSGLLAALEDEVQGKGKPIMGICVGMQLLAEGSDEGERRGLGWIPGRVRRIDTRKLNRPPHLPHMGWNNISLRSAHPLLDGIDIERGFYFLHSYYFDALEDNDVLATVEYGENLPCVVARGRCFGAQFHPEKSHSNGIQLITNFTRWN
jgi:imidazole glycerol-phosphate synthase subunit HisH